MSETEKEFLEKMSKRYDENKYNPELLAHRIDYLFKEVNRLASNEKKPWAGMDEIDGKVQEINGTLRNHRSLNAHLENEIAKLKKELSSCIDVKLLYSDRQARENWQKGCDVMIETLHKKVVDLEYMFKQAFLCVDNSHASDAAKYLGLAPIAQLNKIASEQLKGTNPKGIVFNECSYMLSDDFDKVLPKIKSGQVHFYQTGELKVHHPSRKHLENKLHEKNIRIKELEDQLCMRNHECQAALNESNAMRERVVEISKKLQDANLQIHLLKNPFNGGCKL